jgi:hypothetical protein
VRSQPIGRIASKANQIGRRNVWSKPTTGTENIFAVQSEIEVVARLGRTARQQRADRAIDHRSHATEPEHRAYNALLQKFLLTGAPPDTQTIGYYEEAIRLTRLALAYAKLARGRSVWHTWQCCDERRTRGDRKISASAKRALTDQISPMRIRHCGV